MTGTINYKGEKMYVARFFLDVSGIKMDHVSVLSGTVEEGLRSEHYLHRAYRKLAISTTRQKKAKLIDIKIIKEL